MTSELDINSRKSVFSMIYLAVVGVCVFIIQPGIVQGFVSELGLSPEQAGYVASAEMWGLAITTVLLIVFAKRVDWRKLTVAALLVAVAGNLASVLNTDAQTFTIIRAITGLGLGAMISLPFAMIAMTEKTEANFGFAVVWVLIYGAVGLYLIPWALETIKLDGIFIFLAVFCGIGLLLVANLPRGAGEEEQGSDSTDNSFGLQKLSALAGVLAFNVAVGAVWAYLFLVGIDANIEEQGVANVLTFSQLLGVLGAYSVVFLSSRISREAPLSIAILLCAIGIGFLLFGVNFLFYSIAVYLFNFAWNVVVPYVMATLAAFNDNSKTVIRGSCMQMLGLAIGPYIAAVIVGETVPAAYASVNLFATVMFVLSLILIVPALVVLRGKD